MLAIERLASFDKSELEEVSKHYAEKTCLSLSSGLQIKMIL